MKGKSIFLLLLIGLAITLEQNHRIEAKSFFDVVGNVIHHTVKDVGQTVEKTCRDVRDTTGDAIHYTAKGIGQTTEKACRDVRDTTGDAIHYTAKGIGQTTEKACRDVRDATGKTIHNVVRETGCFGHDVAYITGKGVEGAVRNLKTPEGAMRFAVIVGVSFIPGVGPVAMLAINAGTGTLITFVRSDTPHTLENLGKIVAINTVTSASCMVIPAGGNFLGTIASETSKGAISNFSGNITYQYLYNQGHKIDFNEALTSAGQGAIVGFATGSVDGMFGNTPPNITGHLSNDLTHNVARNMATGFTGNAYDQLTRTGKLDWKQAGQQGIYNGAQGAMDWTGTQLAHKAVDLFQQQENQTTSSENKKIENTSGVEEETPVIQNLKRIMLGGYNENESLDLIYEKLLQEYQQRFPGRPIDSDISNQCRKMAKQIYTIYTNDIAQKQIDESKQVVPKTAIVNQTLPPVREDPSKNISFVITNKDSIQSVFEKLLTGYRQSHPSREPTFDDCQQMQKVARTMYLEARKPPIVTNAPTLSRAPITTPDHTSVPPRIASTDTMNTQNSTKKPSVVPKPQTPIFPCSKDNPQRGDWCDQMANSQALQDAPFIDDLPGFFKAPAVAACFSGDTSVCVALNEAETETEKLNFKKIQDIENGYLVKSCNVNSGKCENKTIREVYKLKSDHLIVLSIGGETIRTTDEHPFFVDDCHNIPSEFIWNDSVVASPKANDENSELETDHNDNDNDRDYGCWVTAKHLEAGLALRTILGKTILVDNIRREEGDFTVFNLDVNNNHNYYVSSLGILVHNCNQVKKAVVREVKDAVKEKVKATRPPTAVGGSKGAPEPLRITPALPRGTPPGSSVDKQKNRTPGNNQAQNKQTNDVSREYKLNEKQKEILHREVSGQDYGYQELREVARQIKEEGLR